MDSQQETRKREVSDVHEGSDTSPAGGGSVKDRARVRVYGRLLYANAAVLTVLVGLSFMLPLSDAEHWCVGLGAAGLLGLNLAMIDEAHRREQRYRNGGLESDRPEDYSDLFIDF